MARKLALILTLLVFFGCNPSYVQISSKKSEKLLQNGTLVDKYEEIKSDQDFVKIKLYQYKEYLLLTAEYRYDTLMKSRSQYYLKDSTLIKIVEDGLVATMTPVNQNAYASIGEEIYHIKNGQKGISKIKKIEINTFSELPKALEELRQKEFIIEELSERKINDLKEEVEFLMKKLKDSN